MKELKQAGKYTANANETYIIPCAGSVAAAWASTVMWSPDPVMLTLPVSRVGVCELTSFPGR